MRRLSLGVVVMSIAACAANPDLQPVGATAAEAPDQSWFQCDGRFDCVVVFDANRCTNRAINSRFAVEFETWTQEFLDRAAESRGCDPDLDAEPRAICRNRQCEIADSNLEALIEYVR